MVRARPTHRRFVISNYRPRNVGHRENPVEQGQEKSLDRCGVGGSAACRRDKREAYLARSERWLPGRKTSIISDTLNGSEKIRTEGSSRHASPRFPSSVARLSLRLMNMRLRPSGVLVDFRYRYHGRGFYVSEPGTTEYWKKVLAETFPALGPPSVPGPR